MDTGKISGFPEWLPAERMIEAHVLDSIRKVFELNGFVGIETRSVEPLENLESKSETSKEVYILERLQSLKEGEQAELTNRTLGLHFDLTVPLARWVLQHSGDIVFPFRRYQIQKVWRGERPQEGRYREFTQADVDIVGNGELAFHHEVEAPIVMIEALNSLPIPRVRMLANNRKVLQGICEVLEVANVEDVLRAIDKIDKIGPEGVRSELAASGVNDEAATSLLKVAEIEAENAAELREAVAALGFSSPLLEEGLNELAALLEEAVDAVPGQMVAALRIVRGLDYYTGTVYETVIPGHEDFGSICSGGRYDALARDGKRVYPGVGMSIGVSRLMSLILSVPLAKVSRSVPSAVLVAVDTEETRALSNQVARALRARGIPCEVAPKAAKYGKQIKYADKRGIPFVWFPGVGEVKDVRSGAQVAADPQQWTPPEGDRYPQVVPVAGEAGE